LRERVNMDLSIADIIIRTAIFSVLGLVLLGTVQNLIDAFKGKK
jgi:hypothetical protein